MCLSRKTIYYWRNDLMFSFIISYFTSCGKLKRRSKRGSSYRWFREMLRDFKKITIRHCNRESNVVAHELAEWGRANNLSMWNRRCKHHLMINKASNEGFLMKNTEVEPSLRDPLLLIQFWITAYNEGKGKRYFFFEWEKKANMWSSFQK